MRPITLALVRQRYAEDGGAERFVARLLEALAGKAVRVTLITRQWTEAAGVDVVTVNPFYIGRWWRDWSFARGVRRLTGKRHFDVVQSHERIAGCDVYRAGDGVHREWLAQRARVLSPCGRWLQAVNPYHRYVKRAEQRVFTSPRLKAVICNSKMVQAEIERYFGVASEKFHVIYNGVDLGVYHPSLRRHRAEIRARHGIPDGAPLFLFVGSGFERKGVPALLEAMTRLDGTAHLLIVGRDKKRDKYERRARALGLDDRAVFAGHQSDVKPYYGAADALVLPTLYDPFPNVVLEAMASGLPVITSRKCGAAELIREGENGFVCDALDVPALAACLRRLMSPERASALGARARTTVETMDLGRMGQAMVEMYDGLLHS